MYKPCIGNVCNDWLSTYSRHCDVGACNAQNGKTIIVGANCCPFSEIIVDGINYTDCHKGRRNYSELADYI